VALKELSPLFEQMYSEVGRPSIPPERLLKASLLMSLYTVRSERMFGQRAVVVLADTQGTRSHTKSGVLHSSIDTEEPSGSIPQVTLSSSATRKRSSITRGAQDCHRVRRQPSSNLGRGRASQNR